MNYITAHFREIPYAMQETVVLECEAKHNHVY